MLVLPPLILEEMNGSRTRTIEVYSRIKDEPEITLVLAPERGGKPEKHFVERVEQSYTVNGYIGKNPVRLLCSLVRMARIARKMDAILCYHEYGLGIVYSYFVSLMSSKPLAIVVHHVEGGLRQRSRLIEAAFRHCAGIMCLDNDIVLTEVKKLFPKKQVVPVTNGVDTSYYSPENDRKVGICLYVGVLSERKGSNFLLDIWKQVVKKHPGCKLRVLAGITPPVEVEAFLSRAAVLGVRDSIIVMGYVDEVRKRQEFREAEVLVFPSTYEGFGLVVAEALSSGLPAVLWDLPSFNRFREGVFKVPFPDTGAFGEQVGRLLTEKDLREDMARSGVMFAANNLTWEIAAAKEKAGILCVFQNQP